MTRPSTSELPERDRCAMIVRLNRICPLCQAIGDAPLCAKDGIATLLAEVPWSNASSIAPGRIICDRYRVKCSVGRGTSGTVFEAVNVGTGQPVAVKVLSIAGQESSAADVLRAL